MQVTLTCTSTNGNSSNFANLDWRNDFPARISVTASSSTGASDYTLQYTYEDLQLVTSPTWRGVSSAAGSTVAVHYTSTAIYDVGLIISLTGYSALRIASTSNATTLTMRIVQAEGT